MLTLFARIKFRINSITGHGRLIEPPARSSAWQFGFKTPINYNDIEIYCGGLWVSSTSCNKSTKKVKDHV